MTLPGESNTRPVAEFPSPADVDKGARALLDQHYVQHGEYRAVARTVLATVEPRVRELRELHERLHEECERYGLPTGLDGLLRHIYNNRDAALAFNDHSIVALQTGSDALREENERLREAHDSLYARTVTPRRNTGRALTAFAEGRWADAVDCLLDAHEELKALGRDESGGSLLTCGEVEADVARAALARVSGTEGER